MMKINRFFCMIVFHIFIAVHLGIKRFAYRLVIVPLVVIGLIGGGTQSFAADPLLDRIAVVVNDGVITLEAFKRRLAMVKRSFEHIPELKTLSDEALRQKVLQTMIEEQTVEQFSKIRGWSLSEQQLELALQAQANAEGKDLTEWVTTAAQNGISKASLSKQIELQILIGQIRNQIIEPSIHVSHAEIEAFLSERLGKNTDRKVEVQIAHIVLKWSSKRTQDDIANLHKKMEKVQQAINEGQDFSDVAAKYSDFDDAYMGGLLGWRPYDRLPDAYQQALQSIGIGEVSSVLESSNGLHLIKLIDRRSNVLQNIERIRASHILLKVDETQPEARVIEKIKAFKQRLEQGEDFAALARQHSQDLSASNGGDLGWLYPGDTVPEFEKTLDQLQDGAISKPIRSSYGWHLIKQMGRETVPLPEDKARQIARRTIREEKIAQTFRQWIDEQVAGAYIKYYIPH